MINLLRAEWKKTIWNYTLTGFLVWMFPVGLLGFYIVMLVGGLFSRTSMELMLGTGSGVWTEDAVSTWDVVLAFPFNVITRLLPLAFMASVFAGEYSSGMWKNLIPRNRRAFLILIKITVMIALYVLALGVSSVIIVAGQGIGRVWIGWDYGPALSGGELSSFVIWYLQTLLLGVLSLIMLAAAAALATILTRSVLGGLLAAFGFSVLDSTFAFLLLFFGNIFSLPDLVRLYRFAPSCNLESAQSWFRNGVAAKFPFEHFSTGPDLGFSLVMLILWAAGLTALALAVFQRQDITS